MSLPLPNLDDRTYADLIEESRSLIASEYPEWTDHNPSDAGIVLLEMFAWLTEMILYRVNQVPDQTIETFLQLLQGNSDWQRGDRDLATAMRETILGLRQRYRAVTADDFEYLTLHDWHDTPEATALGTEGVIQRVKCLPQVNLATTDAIARKLAPGHVSLVVVPAAWSAYTLQFDRDNDRVELPVLPELDAFTISFWVKLKAASADGGLIASSRSAANRTVSQNDWWFFTTSQSVEKSPGVRFGVGRDVQRELIHTWQDDNQWHHVAGTFDGTSSQLYVDGVAVGTSRSVLETLNLTNGLVLYVNGSSYRAGTQQWDDRSGSNHHATKSPNHAMPTPYAVRGYNGKNFKVMRFDAQDGMTFPEALNVQQPFTAIIVDRYWGSTKGRTLQGRTTNWLLGKHGGTTWCYMGGNVNKVNVAATDNVFCISTVTLTGNTRFWYVDGVAQNAALGTDSPGRLALCRTGPYNEPSQADIAAILVWNRVLTDAERQRVERWLGDQYGIPVTHAGTTDSSGGTASFNHIVIGGSGPAGALPAPVQRQIADVRIWNQARPPQVIQTDMRQPLAGREDGLVGYWAGNESAGDRVYDYTPNQRHGILYGSQRLITDFKFSRLLPINPILQKSLWLFLDKRRLLTTQHHIVSPEFVFITLQVTLRLQAGASAANVRQEHIQRIRQFFDPLQGGHDRQGWEFGRHVYRSEVYEMLDELPGVDYVQTLMLQGDRTCDEIVLQDHQLVSLMFDAADLTLLEAWQQDNQSGGNR